MKVTVKSLKQVTYDVELEDGSITILQFKKKVEELHGFESSTIKFVFNAKMVEDEKTLNDLQIVDGCVLIMISVKAKPVNADPKPQQQNTAQTQEIISNTNTSNSNPQPQTQTQKPIIQQADYSKEIKTLTEEMGFPQEESAAAIKAAKGYITKAIDFLYNGIPDQVELTSQESSSSLDFEGGLANPIKSIASIIKVMCQNNPNSLQNILLGLQQTSPDLIELIRENEEEFRTLVSQPMTDEDMRLFQEFNRGVGPMRQRSQELTGSPLTDQQRSRTGPQQIRVFPEEMEAVNWLKAFGFTEMEAIQAYIACDKNEEHALSFLFDSKEKEIVIKVDI